MDAADVMPLSKMVPTICFKWGTVNAKQDFAQKKDEMNFHLCIPQNNIIPNMIRLQVK